MRSLDLRKLPLKAADEIKLDPGSAGGIDGVLPVAEVPQRRQGIAQPPLGALRLGFGKEDRILACLSGQLIGKRPRMRQDARGDGLGVFRRKGFGFKADDAGDAVKGHIDTSVPVLDDALDLQRRVEP